MSATRYSHGSHDIVLGHAQTPIDGLLFASIDVLNEDSLATTDLVCNTVDDQRIKWTLWHESGVVSSGCASYSMTDRPVVVGEGFLSRFRLQSARGGAPRRLPLKSAKEPLPITLYRHRAVVSAPRALFHLSVLIFGAGPVTPNMYRKNKKRCVRLRRAAAPAAAYALETVPPRTPVARGGRSQRAPAPLRRGRPDCFLHARDQLYREFDGTRNQG